MLLGMDRGPSSCHGADIALVRGFANHALG